MRQHLDALGGHAVARQLPGGPAAGGQEAVDGVEHRGLVHRQRGGVGRRLGQRSAAVEHQPREGVAPAAAKAGAAVAGGDGDRAEQAQVVQVQHHPRTGRASGGQALRADQRLHVVHVHHVGLQRRARRRARSAGRSPPRSSDSAARARPMSADRRSSSACSTPARRSARSCSSTERSSPPSIRYRLCTTRTRATGLGYAHLDAARPVSRRSRPRTGRATWPWRCRSLKLQNTQATYEVWWSTTATCGPPAPPPSGWALGWCATARTAA